MIWPLDRFWPWNRSRGLQNTFQASVRTSASPRTVCAPQIQKILECLASIIKFMIFRNLNFWIFKKPLTVIWTLKFFESFPDWSDPKRVYPCQVCGSRNTFCKSPMWLHTFYWGWDLSGRLTFKDFPPNHEFSGLKSGFNPISTIRSMSISFSLILFMPEGDDRSFHEDLISECVCSLWFIW